MATTLEILLKTTFDGAGLDSATSKIKALVEEANSLTPGSIIDIPQLDFDPAGAEKYAETMHDVAEGLRDQAKAALNVGDQELAKKYTEQANAARGLSNVYKDLAGPTAQKIIESFTKEGQTIQEMAKSLQLAAQAERELAKAALETGQKFKSDMHAKKAQDIDKERISIEKLNTELRQTDAMDSFEKRLGKTTNLKQFEKEVKNIRSELKEFKNQALKSGNSLDDVLQLNKAEQSLKQLSTSVLGADRAFKLFGKDLGPLEKIMTSTFNQFGFVMFITENTMKSIVRIFNSLRNAVVSVADTQNMVRAFGAAVSDAGEDVDSFRLSIGDAAGGLVEFQTALKGAIELQLKLGGSAGALADDFLEVAKKLQIATGSIATAEDVYRSLIDAVTKGDLAALDSIPGFQGLSAELEVAKWQANRLGNEFTAMDTNALAVQLVTDRVSDLNEELIDVQDAGRNAREAAQAAGQFFPAIGAGIAGLFGAAIDETKTVEDSMRSVQKVAGDVVDAVFKVATSGMALLTIAAFTVKSVWDNTLLGIKQTSSGVGQILEGNIAEGLKTLFAEQPESMPLLEAIKVGAKEGADAVAETWGIVERHIRTSTGELNIATGGAIDSAVDKLAEFNQRMLESDAKIKAAFGDTLSLLTFFDTPDMQYLLDLEKETISHGERLEEINQDYTDKINAIRDKGAEDWEKAQIEYNTRSEELTSGLTDKIIDINEDNELKIKRMREDANDKQEEEKKKSKKKLEDIEIDHQKKINDILRKFELSRLKSLIDRDARSLYEAERQRDEDLRKAEEARKEKRDGEIEDSKEREQKINDDLQKDIDRANEDAQRKRDDAVKAHMKSMKDLEDQLQEKRDAILDNMQDQRDDLAEDIKQRSADEKKAHEKRILVMQEAFKQDLIVINAAKLKEGIALLQTLDPTSAAYETLWTDLTTMAEQYEADITPILERLKLLNEEFAASVTIPSLTGPLIPPSGPGGSDPDDGCAPGYNPKFNPALGGVCSQIASTTVVIACDGSRWQCYKGNWIPAGTVTADVQQTGDSGGDGKKKRMMSFGTDVSDNSGGRTGSNGNQVTIVVEGDKTLEQIFREISFSAYIETIT